MEWQPISTAPSNTLVIVCVKNCGVTIGSKHEGIGWAWDVLDDEPEDSEATHWMPLPAPPAA
jgi:hypothetical protein